jgi:hypothetical protein
MTKKTRYPGWLILSDLLCIADEPPARFAMQKATGSVFYESEINKFNSKNGIL